MAEADKTVVLGPDQRYVFFDVIRERRLVLFNGCVIGRSECDVTFPDDSLVSRRHFKIEIQGTEVTLEDLGSANKTKVNGQEIIAGIRSTLQPGDMIEFGNQQLQLLDLLKMQENSQPAIIPPKTETPPSKEASPPSSTQAVRTDTADPEAIVIELQEVAPQKKPEQEKATQAPAKPPRKFRRKISLLSFFNPMLWPNTTRVFTGLLIGLGCFIWYEPNSQTCPHPFYSFPIPNDPVFRGIVVFSCIVFLNLLHQTLVSLSSALGWKKTAYGGLWGITVLGLLYFAAVFMDMDHIYPALKTNEMLCACTQPQLPENAVKDCEAWSAGSVGGKVPFSRLPEAAQNQVTENLRKNTRR